MHLHRTTNTVRMQGGIYSFAEFLSAVFPCEYTRQILKGKKTALPVQTAQRARVRNLKAAGFARLQDNVVLRKILRKTPYITVKVFARKAKEKLTIFRVEGKTCLFPRFPESGGEAVLPQKGAAAGTLPEARHDFVRRALRDEIIAVHIADPDVHAQMPVALSEGIAAALYAIGVFWGLVLEAMHVVF